MSMLFRLFRAGSVCRVIRAVSAAAFALAAFGVAQAATVDHSYPQYARVLRDHVTPPKVDYTALKQDRASLDAAIAVFAQPTEAEERGWTRDERLAFWINAYNAFTLRAIVDHYPIRASWLTLAPRNSIRQIGGVWTTLTWQAAGRTLTLDDIEHRILRPEFKEPRVHFAINCASIGCPPLAAEPYRAATLDAQLDTAARRYLASAQGSRVDGNTLRVSKILEWYGEDFVARFAPDHAGRPDRIQQAVRAVVARFGPPEAAALARATAGRVRFLDYDWSLNDVR
jgi:hypothetical protein